MTSKPDCTAAELAQTMRRIYRQGMTTTSGGNLSARDAEGNIWVTPARLDKATLQAEDMVCVEPGGTIRGRYAATSELPFHLAIYRTRPDVTAVVHAHPAALVAFSTARLVPDTRVLGHAYHLCGEVGLAPYAPPGSAALGESIAGELTKGVNCVVLEHHGVVVAGSSLGEAFDRFETLELTAQTLLKARQVGEPVRLTEGQIALTAPDAAFAKDARPSNSSKPERELREQLCEYFHRGCERTLFTGSSGLFSARVDEQWMLITPNWCDRYSLRPEDLVLVEMGQGGSDPSMGSAVACHAAIYARHKEVNAIAGGAPVCVTAFSLTHRPLRTDIIPESYTVLREIGWCPLELPWTNPDSIAQAISMRQPVLMIENGGVLVAGTSVVDAYDRLEVLESSAGVLLDCHVFGEIERMSEEKRQQLRQAMPEAYGAVRRG